jgi:hypothetical protein
MTPTVKVLLLVAVGAAVVLVAMAAQADAGPRAPLMTGGPSQVPTTALPAATYTPPAQSHASGQSSPTQHVVWGESSYSTPGPTTANGGGYLGDDPQNVPESTYVEINGLKPDDYHKNY